MASAGYSGTPLAKKLGIVANCRVLCINTPDEYSSLLSPMPDGVSLDAKLTARTALVHLFVTERKDLSSQLTKLRRKLKPETPVWVSWPKKASRVPTTVTEDVIRDVALPLGYVDVKVCAVSEVWSGLKLVVRKALR